MMVMGNNTVGNMTFEMDSSYYLLYQEELGNCTLQFMPSSVLGNFWVLGDAFLRAFVVAHDIDNFLIGFRANSGAAIALESPRASSTSTFITYGISVCLLSLLLFL
mmetsp:Transcript_33333/g.32403  ORF Transcript_33333/g.32403 Transcript_33333/m.32403 type:complete len:106 (-) Transcript_33333:48-365(-)